MKTGLKRIIAAALLLLSVPTVAASGEDFYDIRVKMTAEVLEVGEELLVEVIESEYTSGPHLVIIASETLIADGDGEKISPSDIKIGDRIEIFYNGQVMMSYPPRIVARKIVKIK